MEEEPDRFEGKYYFCMKPVCLTMLLFAAQAAEAQDIPILIEDHFEKNRSGWFEGTGNNYTIKVEKGIYKVITLEEGRGRYVTLTPYVIKGTDFSLEAAFLQRSGSDDNGLGLLWGGNSSDYHSFVIACNGYYKVMTPESRDDLNKWVETADVNPVGEVNRLKVEQRNSRLHFFINGKEAGTADPLPWYGNKIGLTNYTKMVLEIDDFIFRHDIKINLPPNLTSGLVKENLGPEVNSKYEDLSPKISADGSMILFSRQKSPDNIGGVDDSEDVWFTHLTGDGQWSPSKNMGRPVNDENINNLTAISADNNTLMFAKPDGFQLRRRTANGWSDPENIDLHFPNEAGHMEANLSADRKAILFTAKLKSNVNYKADIDEKDIYVSTQDKSGDWSQPVNLGNTINTAGDEVSPFLAADGRTLYFATDDRPGYGGHDIFMSKRLMDGWTKWLDPVNLGPEINTPGFDGYFTLPASGEYAYLCSEAESYGKLDLIRVKLPKEIKPDPVVLVHGKTIDAKTNRPVSAEIFFENLATHAEVGKANSNPSNGDYRIVLPFGANYGFRAVTRGYLSVNENLELDKTSDYTEFGKDLYLVPIEVGQAIPMKNVFFVQSKSELMPESSNELDRLAIVLKENPAMEIDLAGHTDNRGDPSGNFALSEDRVKAVIVYLVGKGVSKNRLSGQGYGGTRPIVPNDTDEHRQLNRRVEFKITKK